MLDIGTIFFCTLASQMLLTTMFAVVYFGRLHDGLGEWIAAGLAQVVGLTLFLFFDALPVIVYTSVAIFLLSLSASLFRASIKKFYDEPVHPVGIWLVPAICFVQHAIWMDDIAARLLFGNVVLGLQGLVAVRPLVGKRIDGTMRSRGVLIVTSCLFSLSLFARAFQVAWWPESIPDLRAPGVANTLAMLVSFLTILMLNVGLLLLHQDRAIFKQLQMSLRDALTGIKNRRGLMDAARREVAKAHRTHAKLVVMMLDLDHFKELNDTLGHPTGDTALRRFAETLKSQARESDLVARYGGEEFCVLLPQATPVDAEKLAQRVRDALSTQLLLPSKRVIRFSAGVSQLRAEEPTLDAALARADAALYLAKQQGRDRVVVAALGQ
jgi:diguanylate cyclase (GGDEF)-like protein